MRFLPFLLYLLAASAWAQPAPTNPQQVTAIVANSATTGTTLNKLAKLTSSGAVILATTDTSAYGVVVGGAGITGNAQIVISGNTGCVFDGATTQGNWVIPSTTTGGDCHDSGSASTASPPVGAVAVVQSTNGGAGTYLVTQRVVSAPISAGVSSVTCGTGLSGGTITSSGTCAVSLSSLTNSLSANVLLNSISTFFDGPSVSQGATGMWWASGTVTLTDTNASAFICKLWDGTTVIDSSVISLSTANGGIAASLSGFLASPAGNIRISCKNSTDANGLMVFNSSGNSKDSTVSVFRIN